VAVRVRPLAVASGAVASRGRVVVEATSPQTVCVAGKHAFGFDAVLGAAAAQSDVFDTVGRPLADYSIAGYNSCVFA